jgi:hypothetical protein
MPISFSKDMDSNHPPVFLFRYLMTGDAIVAYI